MRIPRWVGGQLGHGCWLHCSQPHDCRVPLHRSARCLLCPRPASRHCLALPRVDPRWAPTYQRLVRRALSQQGFTHQHLHLPEIPTTRTECSPISPTVCPHLRWKHTAVVCLRRSVSRQVCPALAAVQPLSSTPSASAVAAKVYERPPPQLPAVSLHSPSTAARPARLPPVQGAHACPLRPLRPLGPRLPTAVRHRTRPGAPVSAAAPLPAARAHRRSASIRLADALSRRNCVSTLAEPASAAGLRPHRTQEALREDGTGAPRYHRWA